MRRTLVVLIASIVIGLSGCASVGVWKDSVRDTYSSVRERYVKLKAKIGPIVDGTSLEPLARKAALVLEAADKVVLATDRMRGGECAEVEEVIPDACSKLDQIEALIDGASDAVEDFLDEISD